MAKRGRPASKLKSVPLKDDEIARLREEILPADVRDQILKEVRWVPKEGEGDPGAPFYRALRKYLASGDIYNLAPGIALMDATVEWLSRVADENLSTDVFKDTEKAITAARKAIGNEDLMTATEALAKLERLIELGHYGTQGRIQAAEWADKRNKRTEAALRLELAQEQTLTYRDVMQFIADVFEVVARLVGPVNADLAKEVIAEVRKVAAERAGIVMQQEPTPHSPEGFP